MAARVPGHTEEHERARQLGEHIDTIRKRRKRGEGQAYIVIGRSIFYVDADEPRWLESLRVTPVRRARAPQWESVKRKVRAKEAKPAAAIGNDVDPDASAARAKAAHAAADTDEDDLTIPPYLRRTGTEAAS